MTYKEAIDAGYVDADICLCRGYVSRKVNIDNQPVKEAGGNRKGDLYVLLPNYKSTRFCYRQYLKRKN